LAKDALLILTIGQAVCSIFGSAPVYLNRETTYISRIVLAVVLNLGLNRFLIPIYGMPEPQQPVLVLYFEYRFSTIHL
jgi:hypothetical protein